jgi:hypothetical protein
MSLILSGTDGLSDVDGTAGTPAIRGTDANTGIFFPAADTIAFSEGGVESMRIDSSGNVGIGTTSPVSSAGYTALTLNNATNSGYVILQSNGVTKSDWYSSGGSDATLRGVGVPLNLVATGANYIYATTNGSERMRITSSGDVGIGNSVPTSGGVVSRLRVRQAAEGTFNGIGIEASTSGSEIIYISNTGTRAVIGQTYLAGGGAYQPICFDTSGTERMRITSGGFVKASNTGNYFDAVGGYHELRSNQNTNIVVLSNTAASGNVYGPYIAFTGQNPNNTTSYFLGCYDAGEKATIRSNGGIANFSANDVNLSDRREKTNFAPSKSYLDTICSIPVQTFNYIDQNMEEDSGLTLGVVAQDVQAVAPELVHESNWAGKDQPEKMRLSIYQTDLQYALMKCIQEQQQIINDLKARIETLESK